jgi:4-amino-4-deoxy-L-arabinose transferase-like glycosyltransferase
MREVARVTAEIPQRYLGAVQPLRKHAPEIGLLVLLILFVALKIPDLSLPYFWDEIGVYAPGALRMHDAEISLMPAALDPEYSRGHPLMAIAFYASWMRIFGDGVVPAHAASLALGCATLAAQYFGTRRIIGKFAALLGTVFTAVQPIFWAMSGVVLPEMLLTLMTVLCLYGLARPRLWVYVLAGSGAVLTKESGLTIPAAACLFFLLEGFTRRDIFSLSRWARIGVAAAPFAVFGLFLLVQKEQNGWYFFPYHIGFIDLSPSHIWHAGTRALHDVFFQQGRWHGGSGKSIHRLRARYWFVRCSSQVASVSPL